MSEDFYRIKRLPPYVIAEVNAMRAAARAAGEDIIDLGMGNPDLPPPQHVIDKLCEVARKPDAHGYSQSKGIPGLRRAQANYYGRRFGVELDPETEVVVTMGSKEGLASLATAITAPGDVVLAPNPSYPIHTFGFIIAGATIRAVPTTPDEHYFESARAGDERSPCRGRRSWSSTIRRTRPPRRSTSPSTSGWSPGRRRTRSGSSPTSPIRSSITTASRPPSILQVQGREGRRGRVHLAVARPTRWPAGGSASRSATRQLIAAMTRVKSYLDYGAFTPIQAAAVRRAQRPAGHRREEPRSSTTSAATCWSRASAAPAGTSRRRRASMFAWAPLPPALAHLGSLEFSKQLLTHAKVAVAPGVGYGEDGEGFVRIAMVENEQRLRQAARNVRSYLQSMGVNTPSAKAG